MKKLLVALVLLGLVCFALCDDAAAKKSCSKSRSRSKSRSMGGPCPGGFWPDGNGCCPKKIDKLGYFYRDFQGCYPNSRGLYADAKGFFPNSKGVYRSAGSKGSRSDRCHPACIRPNSKSNSRSNSRSHSKSRSHTKSCSKSQSRSRSHSKSQSRSQSRTQSRSKC